MSDGVIVSSGFRLSDKVRSIINLCFNVVDGTIRPQKSSRGITAPHSRSSNSHHQFQRDQRDVSIGVTSEKIGRLSMFDWLKKMRSNQARLLKQEFENLHRTNADLQNTLRPYLDTNDPLIALTLTLLHNRQKRDNGDDTKPYPRDSK